MDAWFAENAFTRRPSLGFLCWSAETGRTAKLTLPTGKTASPAPSVRERPDGAVTFAQAT